MTTTATAPIGLEDPPSGHYGPGGVLSSEWTKLTSVRSTIWTLVITAVVGTGIGVIVTSAQAARFSTRSPAARLAFDPTRSSLAGMVFAQLAIGVLGALMVTAEYSTGTVRTTFAAVPRRPMVLVAKVVLCAVVAFVVGEIVSFTAFLLGQHILSGKTPTASLWDPTVVRAVVSAGLYLTALGLLALGLATIIRHTASAISTFVGLLFILPILADVLPSSFANDVDRFLPANIGTRMMSVNYHGADPFGPWLSFTLLCCYVAVLLIAGSVLLVRQDA